MLLLCSMQSPTILCPVQTAGLKFKERIHSVLARCHNGGLNQALSVLSLSLGFLIVSVVLLTKATFCIVLFVCFVSWLFLLDCQYQCK